MRDDFCDDLAGLLGERVSLLHPLRGGDVAEAFRVDLAGGRTVFAKTHQRPIPGFFVTEASGLFWLAETGAVQVPAVLAVRDDDSGKTPWLVLEWVAESVGVTPDETAFGRALAALHGAGASCFGREDGRRTGSRGLPNQPCESWAEFYSSQRLLPLAALLRNAEQLGAQADRLADRLETVAGRIADLLGPAEPPSRLHGDLWAGNRIVDRNGVSWLVDPACFGGHREFDLAMMRLFGGFGPAAYASYEEVAPLAAGWQERIPLHQLAPLAVHTVKFAGRYPATLARALQALGA
ncbi:MAG: fructosamine kinase family protein [Acidimicrobiales bacterium]